MQFCEIKYNAYSKWASLKSTSGCLVICLHGKQQLCPSMSDNNHSNSTHSSVVRKRSKKRVQLALKPYPKKYSKNLLLPFGLLKKISKPNWNYIDIISVLAVHSHFPKPKRRLTDTQKCVLNPVEIYIGLPSLSSMKISTQLSTSHFLLVSVYLCLGSLPVKTHHYAVL